MKGKKMELITDLVWEEMLPVLRKIGVRVGQEADCRCFVTGVAWILRTGAQWRELPEQCLQAV